MKMEDDLLKNYIKDGKYDKCIDILKEKIISEVEKNIKLKNNTYRYTDIFDLINACEKYIEPPKNEIMRKMYRAIDSDLEDPIKVSLLIELYEILKS